MELYQAMMARRGKCLLLSKLSVAALNAAAKHCREREKGKAAWLKKAARKERAAQSH